MKKGLLLFSTTMLIAGLLAPVSINPAYADDEEEEYSTAEKISMLFDDYIGIGNYTKKTTINLNDDTIAEMASCFHCGLTATKRTTYYTENKLLLAAENGSIPVGSGAYIFDEGEQQVKRATALDGSNEMNMWENLSEPAYTGQTDATMLEDYFVTLNSLVWEDCYEEWGENNGTFFYDLTPEEKAKNADNEYNCQIWNDFLYFCAPMLYKNSGYYLSAKSLTIKEKYDANAEPYLALTMYLDDSEREGKQNADADYFAQARIYRENVLFQENLSTGYCLAKGSDKSIKLEFDEESATKQWFVKNVELEKGDAVKIWSTDGNYHGVGDSGNRKFSHNLSVDISTTSGLRDNKDNYVVPQDGMYDFYVKLNDDGSYKDVYVYAQDTRTIYVQDTWDKGGVTIHYWGSDIIGSNWDACPHGADTNKYDSGHKMYKFVIPSAAEHIIIRYNNNQSADIDLVENKNAYWISDAGSGKPAGNPYTWNA